MRTTTERIQTFETRLAKALVEKRYEEAAADLSSLIYLKRVLEKEMVK